MDYIVEQGTNGIWTYRKWNLGIVEFFGMTSFSGKGNVSVPSVDFPLTLTSLIYKAASIVYEDGNKAMCVGSGTGANCSLTNTGVYVALQDIYDETSKQTGIMMYHVVGRWK